VCDVKGIGVHACAQRRATRQVSREEHAQIAGAGFLESAGAGTAHSACDNAILLVLQLDDTFLYSALSATTLTAISLNSSAANVD
jgi:hypothetical protein